MIIKKPKQVEDLKGFWGKNIKIVTKDFSLKGIFCSFERPDDDPEERGNITIEDEYGCLRYVYLDEIEFVELL